ncbi:GM11534 [Drosophila sechellia]|uniref:GM11534 n=1 Tax=Drosophila sechellia TaxID=7238 RepID=B4IGJ1_DROSE|nr:GM11534 [Drosophila sechellia]
MDCKEAISKEQAVSRIAHNDFIIVSRQLLINRADTDKDKRSAKMLIIYSTGTQHIVTFKLPIHACTVQELFLKMNLHIEDNITIDCMENAGGIIHLVVSVGFAIGDTIADTIAKAEEYYKKVHQSRASAVAAPRNAVPVEEPPSRAVVKPSETSVANNGSQPAATKGKKHKKRHCAPGDTNADKVISSSNQDANTPKTKKHKKGHSAKDRNGYQAAGAQDKPAQVISSADQDDNTPKTKKQMKRHSAEDSNGYQAAGAQDKPGSSGNKQGNQTPTGNTSTSPKKSNTAQVISSADQDDNTPKTKKQKKRHSAEDSNGYQAAGAQDKPGSSGNKQGNQTPTGNTSTSPKKSNTAQVISSADQDDNTPKTKKQKKRHSAEDSNGYQAAGAQDKPCSSGNKQGNQTPTGNTSNSPKKSNGLQGVQPAGDALASSQSIQSKDQVAHATVSKKSEETAGGSQSRVQPNVAYIPAPAEKATSDTIPTPAERAEKSRLRRNRNWILSRDFDEEVIVLLSSEDEETTAADNGQTEGRLSVDENPTLFTYPPTGTGGLSITIKDFMCLKEGSYLNDIIIDFYLRWLKNNIIPEGQRDGTHIFSTFFYKRLTTDTSPNKKKTPVAQRRHERVKKWTRNVNIFEKDFIIIPFNDQSHWILAIICFPYLTSSVVNDDVQTPGEDIPIKQPLILIFDSLADSKRNRDMAILRDYLNFEYKAKHPRQRARIFNRDNMPGLIVEVPQQENLTDCGLYLLQYAEQFFTKPIVNYKLPITELIDWFDLLTVTKKREDIANLIQNLMNEGNQQGITMPVIKFPTLNGIMVMDVDDEKECDTEEENQTINQYSFKTRAPPKRRHTLK